MNIHAFADQYLNELKVVLEGFDHASFEKIISAILEAYDREQYIFVMGNGGSGATASHFACDINKGCCLDLDKKFKMFCLNDNIPTLLALANDVSYDVVFEEQLKNFFRPGDLTIGISGSGNSENVIRAVTYAKQNGGRTIGLCGFSGGRLSRLADIAYIVRVDDMQKIEDVHVIVVHMIMQAVHKALHDR
ncbi:MAG: SIS domain-containing protein [Thermodesulfobacteriota bacterium]